MAISDVGICNLALMKVGDESIMSLQEDSKAARACKLIYEPTRDRLLAAHPWNFALKRTSLARLSEKPPFEYEYQFQLPTDCLRVWKLYDSTSDYVVEGGKLLIDDTQVKIKYIARITDPNLFSPAFVSALATALAVELSVRLTDSKVLKQTLMLELKEMINQAYLIDAIEGSSPDEQEDTIWQNAGR